MSSVMNGVVKEICESMLNNPNRWRIETYTIKDKQSGVEYWIDNGWSGSITHIWNGHSRDRVFSCEQGQRIYQSFVEMKEHKASVAQQKILDSFKVKSEPVVQDSKKSWWEFWK